MTEGTRNLCMLEVITEFAESISKKAQYEFRFAEQKAILDVSAYRKYCTKLLSNNGLSPESDIEEIEKFMQEAIFNILNLTGVPVSGMRWLGTDKVWLIR